jgi:O-antigen ligase
MGLVMGTLLPLYYEALRRRMQRRPWIVALVLISWAAILLSENRTSWFMSGLGTLGYGYFLMRIAHRITWPRIIALGIAGALVLGAFATQYAPLRSRIIVTSGLFSGNYKEIDMATSYRLSLWRTALNMYEAHWLNGVGPRGYRYVYEKYAAKDDWWIRHGSTGQTHPHQTTLEIAAETGSFGLIGYALLWLVLYRYYRRKDIDPGVKPWAIAMVVAMFPLNVHMAFYASYWGSVYWWLICVGLALSRPAQGPPLGSAA